MNTTTIDMDSTRRLITVRIVGLFDKRVGVAAIEGIRRLPSYDYSYDTIFDLSATTEWNLSPQDLRDLAGTNFNDGPNPGRIVFAVGSDTGRLILAKLYKTFANLFSPYKQEVFKTFEDAENWLAMA